MSNNNNHILSGLFRSLSRRGQQRNTEPEPSDPQRADVDMDNQQPTVTPMDTSTTTSSSFVPSSVDEQQSDELMPDLQDVSDSDESNGADWDFEDQNDPWYPSYDLEPSRTFPRPNDLRMNPQQNAPSSVPSRPTPSSTPSQGTRRARVEDDVDGDSERDRRHPSQRTSANTSEPSSIPIASMFPTQANEQSEPPFVHPLFQNLPPGFGITVTGGTHSNTDRRGHQHHFVPVPLMPQMGFDARTNTQNGNHGHSHNGSPLGNNPESPVGEPGQDAGTEQPQGATHTNLNSFTAFIQSLLQAAGGQPGVAFSTTLNGVPVGNNMPNTGTPNGGNFLSNLFTAMSGMQGGPFTFNAGPGGIPFFGFRSVQEREDPERAKVLVDGLEEVPVGLIRRLERVSPESSGCAICWEKLLEEDAEYLKREEEEEKQKAADPSKVDNDHNDVAQNTSTELPSSSGSKANTPSNKVPKYPRIVALPCSHVFHADCLLPWFSRPRQTTCPTCRFNIDPDDLTRGIGARRRAAASAAAGGRGTERGTERVPREGPLPNVPPRIDENQFVDPVTGLALPQGDNAPGMPWANDSGNYVYIPIGTPIPGVPAGGFWAPRNAPVTSRTASTQPTNNTQGSTPSSTANTSTNPNVTERDTAHSTPSSSNASNVNASANRSTPVAGNPYIDPATSATAGASRFSSRRLFGMPVEQTPTPDGRPLENTRAPATASPATNTPQAPPSSYTAMPPHGHIPHHHHAGDSFVSIGFDFILGPNPSLVGPPHANFPAGPAGNAPQNRSSADASNTAPHSDDSRAPPNSAPRNQQAERPPSAGHAGAEHHHQDMPGGMELHAFGFDFSPFDPNSIIPEGMMNIGVTGHQHTQADPQGPSPPPNLQPFAADMFLSEIARAASAVDVSSGDQPPIAQGPTGAGNAPANGTAPPNANAPHRFPDFSGYFNSMFAAPGAGGNRQGVRRGGSRSQSTARGGTRAQQRRQWAPPPAPGLTLRQTVERREREAGLRCWDVSCGLAPDDNCPYREIAVERRRQIKIQQDATASGSNSQEGGDLKGKGKEKADEEQEPKYICEHTFHTPCLVTAQRVALNGSEENVVEGGKSVEVSCPICRLSGVLPRDDWEDGVRALEAELD